MEQQSGADEYILLRVPLGMGCGRSQRHGYPTPRLLKMFIDVGRCSGFCAFYNSLNMWGRAEPTKYGTLEKPCTTREFLCKANTILYLFTIIFLAVDDEFWKFRNGRDGWPSYFWASSSQDRWRLLGSGRASKHPSDFGKAGCLRKSSYLVLFFVLRLSRKDFTVHTLSCPFNTFETAYGYVVGATVAFLRLISQSSSKCHLRCSEIYLAAGWDDRKAERGSIKVPILQI